MKFIDLLRKLLLAAVTAIALLSAHAEDIDLYVGNGNGAGASNVLFIIDNAGAFSASAASCTYLDANDAAVNNTAPSLNGTAGGIEQCALYNAIARLDNSAQVKLGVMVYNDTGMVDVNGRDCESNEGGCLVFPPLDMSVAANRTKMKTWIRSWVTSGTSGFNIKANSQSTGVSMWEAWAFYAGSTGPSGRNYSGVGPAAGCAKNYVVFIGNAFGSNGTPGDGGSIKAGVKTQPAGTTPTATAGQTFSSISIPAGTYGTSTFTCGTGGNASYSMPTHNESSGLYADEWARFMYSTDLYSGFSEAQNITTYTIGLLGTDCKPDYPALLQSMARVGGGKYYATSDYTGILNAVISILNEVQSINSVFTSASLPVSVNSQGTYLNQVFFGLFRPDASGAPRWLGNLKQYQVVKDGSGVVSIADANGLAALSSGNTGFFTDAATSFWTYKDTAVSPDAGSLLGGPGGFFVNNARGDGGAFDLPDGPLVEKGGVAQQMRRELLKAAYSSTSGGPRRLYTYCPSGTSCNTDLTATANAFTPSNAALNTALQAAGNQSVSVTRIERSGTTVTVTTSAAHGLVATDQVTIAGAQTTSSDGYNGTWTVVSASGSTFTFAITENPPSPASGTYQASRTSATSATIASITRSGTTATVTTLGNHGFTTGDQINIDYAAETEYNGTFAITVTGATTFTYTVPVNPPELAGGGTAAVGTSVVNIETFSATGQTGVSRTGATGATDTVTVNAAGSATFPAAFTAGATVTLAGVTTGASASAATGYNGTFNIASVSTNKRLFTFSVNLSPATPATRNTALSGTATKPASPVAVTLVRSGDTVTATSASAHGFVNGTAVVISGSPGASEGAYLTGAAGATVSGVTANTFQYTITTTPAPKVVTTAGMTATKFGNSSSVDLINWVRGQDNVGDEASPGAGITVRPSVHGDVVHSRPTVVNYGDSRGIVVFYGANSGVFHAINGSQTANITFGSPAVTVAPGGELWGLVLREHYGKLNRQRVNTPELQFSTTSSIVPAAPKDYFVDGSIGTYQRYNASGAIDKAYLYLSMRRGNADDGSRFILALDVTTPTAPRVLWTLSSSQPDFSELGQTWSLPQVVAIEGYINEASNTTLGIASSLQRVVPTPVLVFGGGYAPTQDTEPPGIDARGRAIFVVDAVTGQLVWRASPGGSAACLQPPSTPTGAPAYYASAAPGCVVPSATMTHSIPSDIAVLDRDSNGYVERAYVGDMGGNVWRVDFGGAGATPDTWAIKKLAALGCASGGAPNPSCTGGLAPRKFFYPPSILAVGNAGDSGSYDLVMLGSGDREHPLATQAASLVANRFFVIQDEVTGRFRTSSDSVINDSNLQALSTDTSNAWNPAATDSGYYVGLASGEKVVNGATTVRGSTFFGTNTPQVSSGTTCVSGLGEAKSYKLSPFTGTNEVASFRGGGFPPTPFFANVKGVPTNNGGVVTADPNALVSVCFGCGQFADGADKQSAVGSSSAGAQIRDKRLRRSYWFKR